MKSLTRKLVIYCGILLFVVSVCIGFFSYYISLGAVKNEVDKSLENLAKEGATIVQESINAQFNAIDVVANKVEIIDPAVPLEDKIAILTAEVKRAGHIRMGIADANGSLTSSNGAVSDIKDRQYYINAMAGKASVSDPIVSKVDGSVLVAYAVPIKNEGKITGVLIAFRDGNNLSDITDKITFGKTGSAYMITQNGTTIAHKNRDIVKNLDNDFENVKTDPKLASLVELEKNMVAGQTGVGDYSYNGAVKYMGYAPVEGTLWSLAVTAAKSEVMSGVNNLRNAIVIISAVLLILGLLFVYIIARRIVNPLNKLVGAANKIAGGDLNVTVDVQTKDEIGVLAQAFKDMAENMNDIISNINSASEQVASGSRQVSDSSMALSQGATEQASSVEELTASMEEISSQTKENAAKANQANKLAETAKDNAMQGNAQMQEMLKAMVEINDASSNISKIIKVIDEIAFQTNILALNAAVEAARAGQHGKGFAVVAEEVRNLAARSANAAKETTEMIEGSIKKTESGTKIANETAKALNSIVDDIAKVANLIHDITTASDEQAAGIGQVNQGIMQISQVVQNNSATSEESAAASEELASQAEILKDQVSRFKLRKGSSSFNKYDELNPSVIRMLDNKLKKNSQLDTSDNNSTGFENTALGNKKSGMDGTYSEAVNNKRKIFLNDKDFGKY